MSTDLSTSAWIDLFRAFIGDDEPSVTGQYKYNVTSLRVHLRIGAILNGYTISDPTKPSIAETIMPDTIKPGLILIAYSARSLLKPRKQLKTFGAGSPRRTFTFDNVNGALQRAQGFICTHDPNYKMPSDHQTEIYTIFNVAQIAEDTVDEVT